MAKKPSRKKQLEIKGAERQVIDEIDEAVETMLEHTEAEKNHGEKRKEAHAELRAAMKRHKQNSYRWFDGEVSYLVKYEGEREGKVSVRKEKQKKNAEAAA